MKLPGKEEKRKTTMGVYRYTEGGYPNTAGLHCLTGDVVLCVSRCRRLSHSRRCC